MVKESESFELAKSYLGKTVEVQIDRPMGSLHPKHRFLYESNYGFVPGILAPDGEDLDAYFLGVEVPVEKAKGICIAVIHRINDNDDKLVVVPEDKKDLSDEEIEKQTHFQEQFFEHKIVRFSNSQNLAN
jgi:inorganic pyrophosphatase